MFKVAYHVQTLQGHLTNTKTVTCWQWHGSGISILAKGCPEQYCFQLMSKGRQWLFISDERRQRVPCTGSCNWKRTVSQSPSSRSWNDQCRRGSRIMCFHKLSCLQCTALLNVMVPGNAEAWSCGAGWLCHGDQTEPSLCSYLLQPRQPVCFTRHAQWSRARLHHWSVSV